MNVKVYTIRDYVSFSVLGLRKNKANQTQFQNATMAFSAYDTRDCHGPSGLAMTFVEVFYKAFQEFFRVWIAGKIEFLNGFDILLEKRLSPGEPGYIGKDILSFIGNHSLTYFGG